MTVGQFALERSVFATQFSLDCETREAADRAKKLPAVAYLEVINRHSMMIAPVNPVQGTAFKDAPTNYCRTARTRLAQLAAGTGSPPRQPGRRAAVGRCKARAVDRDQIWPGQPG